MPTSAATSDGGSVRVRTSRAGVERERRGRERDQRPRVPDAAADHRDERADQAPDVEHAGAGRADAHRERALAGDDVGLDVAHVVGEQDRRTPEARPRAHPTTPRPAAARYCTYALPTVATKPKNASTITSPRPM